jgi:hypothetical protein
MALPLALGLLVEMEGRREQDLLLFQALLVVMELPAQA